MDAEYNAHYDRIVMASRALVDSGRVQSGEGQDLELQGRSPAAVELLGAYKSTSFILRPENENVHVKDG